MSALVEPTTRLSYLVNDADEHSTPPVSAYQQYVDPDKRHLAITDIRRQDGKHEMIWGGRPDPSPVKRGYAWLYTQHVEQASLGADFDFLKGGSGSVVSRDSH